MITLHDKKLRSLLLGPAPRVEFPVGQKWQATSLLICAWESEFWCDEHEASACLDHIQRTFPLVLEAS